MRTVRPPSPGFRPASSLCTDSCCAGCAGGYQGTAAAAVCSTSGPYTLSGCALPVVAPPPPPDDGGGSAGIIVVAIVAVRLPPTQLAQLPPPTPARQLPLLTRAVRCAGGRHRRGRVLRNQAEAEGRERHRRPAAVHAVALRRPVPDGRHRPGGCWEPATRTETCAPYFWLCCRFLLVIGHTDGVVCTVSF